MFVILYRLNIAFEIVQKYVVQYIQNDYSMTPQSAPIVHILWAYVKCNMLKMEILS